MIARGFRPVVWVFMIGAAVLGCYMLNLRVAAERAELAKLDRRIIATQQSIRALQTEVGTRSRIPQLEQWNDDVLALAAPATGQYLQQDVSLARYDARQPVLSDQAEVRMASAETGDARAPDAPVAAPQRAVAAPAQPAAARPEVRRASLLIAPERPKARTTDVRPARETEPVIRTAARDDVRPGPREDRARPAARDERRAAPVRTAARDEPRPAAARTSARDERRPARAAAREEARPAPARSVSRAAAAPARGSAGRALATQRPTRELRREVRPGPRRGNGD